MKKKKEKSCFQSFSSQTRKAEGISWSPPHDLRILYPERQKALWLPRDARFQIWGMMGKGVCQHTLRIYVNMRLSVCVCVHLSVNSCMFMLWESGEGLWVDFCGHMSVCLRGCVRERGCRWTALSLCMCVDVWVQLSPSLAPAFRLESKRVLQTWRKPFPTISLPQTTFL